MNEENKNLISIITPVYNVENYIVETMESVRNQTYEDWELLLVDDHSSDKTVERIREYLQQVKDQRIRLILQSDNVGAAKSRNKGLSEARGRYIAYLDADDLWEPEKLTKEQRFMEEKQAAFVFTGYEFANEAGVGSGKVVRVPERLSYHEALKNTTIFTSTVLFDTDKIPRDQLKMPVIKSEDTALWWKVLRAGYTAYGLDLNLVRYRRVGGSLSANKLEALSRIWNLYRKAEGMSVISSAWHFCFWAVNAVSRRI